MESSKLKKLDITHEEAERIAKAFENEEFRKLFKEYAEEIADPENRRRYEEEIAMLEGERGVDVKFVNPEPGYVLKTSQNGTTKVFINICKNENIEKPSAKKKTENGRSGLSWQIPHSFAPPRDDSDKSGGTCVVYDVVFHPDTYRMAENNARFKKLIHDTALDGIEAQFSVKLDKKNLKYPKMKFKGMARPTIIRTKRTDFEQKELDADDPLGKIPYPFDDKRSDVKAAENAHEHKNKVTEKQCDDEYTTPKYSLVHRHDVEWQNFTSIGADTSQLPKELVITIDLPLIQSATAVNLDIFEKKLSLLSEKPAKYKLDISLPYAVEEENSSAKFDKVKRTLQVTMPVVKSASQALIQEVHDADETQTDNS